jgi:hypothetical protein
MALLFFGLLDHLTSDQASKSNVWNCALEEIRCVKHHVQCGFNISNSVQGSHSGENVCAGFWLVMPYGFVGRYQHLEEHAAYMFRAEVV